MTTTWEYASSRMGDVLPETKAIAKEIFEAAKSAGHEIWFIWGYGESMEHASRCGTDLMIRNEAGGDWVRNYIWNNRARFRLRHVIWEQHITSTVVQPGVRRLMEDRGNSTANHYDHIHQWNFPGVYRPPTTSVSLPSPLVKLTVDGELGPKTIARWQQVMKTPVDGVISSPNSSLVRAVQTRLKATVDSRLVVDGDGIHQDNKFYKTAGALQRYLKSPVDGVISAPVSTVIKALQRRLNENRF